MAFVVKSRKEFEISTGFSNIGPGTYDTHQSSQSNFKAIKESLAPFNIGEQRPMDKPNLN